MKRLSALQSKFNRNYLIVFCVLVFGLSLADAPVSFAVVNPQNGSIGLTGTIPSPPPTSVATITSPSNGQTFSTQPVTVTGLCQSGLLVKLYDNNIFSGASNCTNSSYSIVATLFNNTNNLTVTQYDSLSQASPTSNTTTVTYTNSSTSLTPPITLQSIYAELGADPGSLLTWPIVITGGTAPYAISVDWGDNSPQDLVSQASSGSFNITHTYSQSGIYTVLIKATDGSGDLAYLQLVGIGNGPAAKSTGVTSSNTNSKSSGYKPSRTTVLIIAAILIIFPLSGFWLGSRHRLNTIRKQLASGEHPLD